MPLFQYIAVDYTGEKIKGEMEAKDRTSVINSLRKSDLIIISITELKAKEMGWMKRRARVKLEDLVVFSRQLAALVKAGVSLIKGLNILFAQVENRTLKEVITSVLTKIESGSSLSEALAIYPYIFSSFYVNMIRAGEFSGALDTILERLAQYLEEMSKFNRRVRSAFIYPSVVFSIAMLITGVIIIFVVPGFKSIFESLGATLPLPTQILINLSNFLRGNILYVIVAGVILGAVLKRGMATPRLGLIKDNLKLTLPIIGKLMRKVAIARFSRTLSTLLKGGVSILSAMETSSRTSGNRVIESILERAIVQVSKGEKIGETLSGNKFFAPLVTNLTSIGEETGDLSGMLDKIATFYEEEVDVAVVGLTSLLEPVIIVFLGVVIGGIVISLFLPILQLSRLITP